jgi:hypothetical protein
VRNLIHILPPPISRLSMSLPPRPPPKLSFSILDCPPVSRWSQPVCSLPVSTRLPWSWLSPGSHALRGAWRRDMGRATAL